MLKDVRLSRGMSQSQLADKAGINLRMLQSYEQGKKQIDNARLATILKLCIALDCTMEEVVEADDLFRLLREYKGVRDGRMETD